MDELGGTEAAPRFRGARLSPEILDKARKTLDLGRLDRVDSVSELVPDLGATVDRLVELGPDFGDGSHTELNARREAVIPKRYSNFGAFRLG